MADDVAKLRLQQEENYRFRVSFDNPALAPLITDESAPLGGDAGPNPARLLGAAVANCLAASLLFSLRKFKNAPEPVSASVEVHLGRNEANRMRITNIDVELNIGQRGAEVAMLNRVLAQFEDFCIVTQSVRHGLPVNVTVKDREGVTLHV